MKKHTVPTIIRFIFQGSRLNQRCTRGEKSDLSTGKKKSKCEYVLTNERETKKRGDFLIICLIIFIKLFVSKSEREFEPYVVGMWQNVNLSLVCERETHQFCQNTFFCWTMYNGFV